MSLRSWMVRTVYGQRALLKRLVPVRRPVRVRLREFDLFVRLDDWAVGARIALKRSYEPHVIEAMRPYLGPGKVAIDVGANIGYYTMFLARHVGPEGRVIAFEPGASNCELVRLSLAANRFSNVELHECAVAEVEGVVGYGMDDSNGRITRDDPGASSFQVRSVVLDRLLAAEPRIDVVKVDVEGGEGRVLAGMEALLRRHRPSLFTEFDPWALEVASAISGGEYLTRLGALGYSLHIIPPHGPVSDRPSSREEILERSSSLVVHDHLDLLARPARR